jgi:hypothetical protein
LVQQVVKIDQIKQAVPIALPSNTGTASTITPEGRHNGRALNNNTNGTRARKKNRGFSEMTRLFIGLSLIFVCCSLAYAESANYCHGKSGMHLLRRILMIWKCRPYML